MNIKQAQKLIKKAESYTSFFHRLREENYGQLADTVRRLTFLYPLEQLWVTEQTFGIIINAIVVSPEYRGQGIGTDIMQAIIDYADAVEKPLAVTPSRKYSGVISRLIPWLKGLGFVMNTGKKKDFRFAQTMIRYPQKQGIKEN